MKVDLVPFLYATIHKPKSLISAFTLIELMIVIGIIGILSSIAVPFFEKCYKDIKMYKDFDRIDTLLSAQRANYLILNQPSMSPGYAPDVGGNFALFLPKGYYKPTRYSNNSKHYYEDKFYYTFALEQLPGRGTWWGVGDPFYIDIQFFESFPFYIDRLRDRYTKKGYDIRLTGTGRGWLYIYLPEKFEHSSALDFYYR